MSQILNPGKPELFLPQRPPMLLVSRILEFTEDDVIAEADSKILEPFRRPDGRLPETLCIEMMAQAVGAWAGYWRQQDKSDKPEDEKDAPIGYLLSARNLKSEVPVIPEGKTFRITMHREVYEGPIGSFAGEMKDGDTLIATGRVSVYQPSNKEYRELFGGKAA